jgi:sterol desaturase/sphingolipid hydroxylase (fatty acid hydroxylase superfamily)
MPTPLEILRDPVSLTVLALYAALIIFEALFPARQLPRVKGWRVSGLIAFAVYFFLSSYLPLFWNVYLARLQLLDLSALGTWGGAAVGVLLYEAAVYFWHRSMHGSDRLWRTFHQMHHSAERLDTYGAFWFSPQDMIGFTALFSLCLTLVAGITAEATTLAIYVTTFFNVFQHANIRTPRWLGYLVQRPESHSYHHQRGVHAFNYSDLPLFDLLFGTFNNPKDFAAEQGFYESASARVVDMVLGRDVANAPLGRTEPLSHRAWNADA